MAKRTTTSIYELTAHLLLLILEKRPNQFPQWEQLNSRSSWQEASFWWLLSWTFRGSALVNFFAQEEQLNGPIIIRTGFILGVSMLHFQRVCIHECIVTIGAVEWPFIMKRGFIRLDIMLCFQRVCICKYTVTITIAIHHDMERLLSSLWILSCLLKKVENCFPFIGTVHNASTTKSAASL